MLKRMNVDGERRFRDFAAEAQRARGLFGLLVWLAFALLRKTGTYCRSSLCISLSSLTVFTDYKRTDNERNSSAYSQQSFSALALLDGIYAADD